MKKFVAGNVVDLFNNCNEEDRWRHAAVAKYLSEDPRPLFRIPSADTGTEVFFDDLEMLGRYANLPLPDQQAFCSTIRSALKNAETDRMKLMIKWSETEEKVLYIRLVANHHIDVYLKSE